MKPLPQATRLAARIIGPLFLAAGAFFITQPTRIQDLLRYYMVNEELFLIGAFSSLLIGLLIMMLHPYWKSFTSALISLLGVISTVRGLLMLFMPVIIHRAIDAILTLPTFVPIAGCVLALAGLWMLVISILSPPAEDLGLL